MRTSLLLRHNFPFSNSLRGCSSSRLHTSRTAAFASSVVLAHENPLGLPRRETNPAPSMPRRGGPMAKRAIPHVKTVVAVGSGKGGVGKSTVAVNLAFALAAQQLPEMATSRRLRVGLLDLDVYGPSLPKLMGLEDSEEPNLTTAGALIPLVNHGISCMSMGFLLPRSKSEPSANGATSSNVDTPLVWRGLMVQKAVQQLLFDVDWREGSSSSVPGAGLDILVVDLPPGTGDVHLTFSQLTKINGAVVISTPQDVALNDMRKGVAMFRKVEVPITGLVLNTSHIYCPHCSSPHSLFGSADRFRTVADGLGVPILGELPLVPGVSAGGDQGLPFALLSSSHVEEAGAKEWRKTIDEIAGQVARSILN